jgi:hypothetical protein
LILIYLKGDISIILNCYYLIKKEELIDSNKWGNIKINNNKIYSNSQSFSINHHLWELKCLKCKRKNSKVAFNNLLQFIVSKRKIKIVSILLSKIKKNVVKTFQKIKIVILKSSMNKIINPVLDKFKRTLLK